MQLKVLTQAELEDLSTSNLEDRYELAFEYFDDIAPTVASDLEKQAQAVWRETVSHGRSYGWSTVAIGRAGWIEINKRVSYLLSCQEQIGQLRYRGEPLPSYLKQFPESFGLGV